MKSDEQNLRQTMARLTAPQHACVAIACVDRVEAVVAHFFGDAARVSAVRALLGRRVEAPIEDELAEGLRAQLEATIGELYDDDECGYPMNAVKALAGALYHLAPREGDAPEDVASYVVELADSLGGAASGDAEAAHLLTLVESVLTAETLLVPPPPGDSETPAWSRLVRAGTDQT